MCINPGCGGERRAERDCPRFCAPMSAFFLQKPRSNILSARRPNYFSPPLIFQLNRNAKSSCMTGRSAD